MLTVRFVNSQVSGLYKQKSSKNSDHPQLPNPSKSSVQSPQMTWPEGDLGQQETSKESPYSILYSPVNGDWQWKHFCKIWSFHRFLSVLVYMKHSQVVKLYQTAKSFQITVQITHVAEARTKLKADWEGLGFHFWDANESRSFSWSQQHQ